MHPAVAQRVQKQRTCQAVLETARGVGGLVFDVHRNVFKARQLQRNHVRIG